MVRQVRSSPPHQALKDDRTRQDVRVRRQRWWGAPARRGDAATPDLAPYSIWPRAFRTSTAKDATDTRTHHVQIDVRHAPREVAVGLDCRSVVAVFPVCAKRGGCLADLLLHAAGVTP